MAPEYEVSEEKLQSVRDYLVLAYQSGKSKLSATRGFSKWFGLGQDLDLVILDGEPIVARIKNDFFRMKQTKSIIVGTETDNRFKAAGIDLSEK